VSEYILTGHSDYHGPNPPIVIRADERMCVLVNPQALNDALSRGRATLLTFATEVDAEVAAAHFYVKLALVEVVPIRNAQGQVIGFRGARHVRDLEPTKAPPSESGG
jgi:hypothetical protein